MRKTNIFFSVPPHKPVILWRGSKVSPGVGVGPYEVGDTLVVTCEVSGGWKDCTQTTFGSFYSSFFVSLSPILNLFYPQSKYKRLNFLAGLGIPVIIWFNFRFTSTVRDLVEGGECLRWHVRTFELEGEDRDKHFALLKALPRWRCCKVYLPGFKHEANPPNCHWHSCHIES